MFNFDYYNPTKIIFGKERLAELRNLIPLNAKVMLLYGGGSVEKFGTLTKIRKVLGESISLEFGGIEPNPQYETLMRAVEIARTKKIDYLLAVGGGSVMDGTKFVALAACYEGDAKDILFAKSRKQVFTSALPFGTIVTLSATGSEMNNGGVISFGDGKYHFAQDVVFPHFSLLDPELTFTLPKRQIANGIIDTFVHVGEQYFTYPAHAMFQDRTAEGMLKSLTELSSKAVEEPKEYDTMANLMWLATLGLNGLIGAGVPQDWTSHMLGHELTALTGMDHGRTLAIVFPAVLKVLREQKRAKLLQYARRVWHIMEADEEQSIDFAILKTEDFFRSLEVPVRLSEYGYGIAEIESILQQLKTHGMNKLSETGLVDLDKCREILTAAI
ncbi:MAG: iron-containing alcohol dehydrogenase [Clostridia bacterium]